MSHRLEQLLNSEATFRHIVETADEGVWVEDMQGDSWYVNPKMSDILGYSNQELLKLSPTKLVPPDELPLLHKQIGNRSTQERRRYELKMLHKDGRIVNVRVSSSALRNELGEQMGTLATVTDISDLNHQLEVSEFLTKATGLLASSLDYKTTLTSVANLAVPRICDWCAIDMPGPDDTLERVALAHVDPTKIELALAFQQSYPPDPNARQGAFEVMRTGKSEILTNLTDEMLDEGVQDQRQKEMILALGIRSYMIVPLTARGKNLGTLTLVASDTGARYGERDLIVAEELANYAALAIDNAHLHTEARRELKERIRTEEKIRHQALHDALTKLPNRIFLREQLTQACRRTSRTKKICGILFMDLDRFKVINDSLGHKAGDDLLIGVAERLQESVGPNDTVARFGGDEFVIVTADAGSSQEVIDVTKKIFTALEKPITVLGQEIYVNTSIGIALYPTDSKDIDMLIKHADSALYCAKDQGRNTFCLYSAQPGKNPGKRLALETDLRQALKQEQFELYYQPIYSLSQQRVISAEALLRWNHPVQGLLMPNSFLSYAEDTGIIHALGQWILSQACRQLVAWSNTELSDMDIAVNISPIQFFRSDFVELFRETLATTGADPHHMTLELTERLAMQDIDVVVGRLHELKALGVHIAIDDFGIGHSSLSYLKMLPIDTLKIDKSFVQSSPTNGADDAIVAAVSTLARRLDMRVVAEGVEQQDQLTHLRANNACDEIQGFAICVPLPSAGFQKFVESGQASINL